MYEENKVVCKRCGWVWVQQRKKGNQLCQSCRVKPAQVIQYGEQKCLPWHGDFGVDGVTPFHDGEPYLPGKRICGHSDCVAVNHIEK